MEKVVKVAAALIVRGDTFMICKRPPHKVRGLLWEFVGGKLEQGESGEEALIRECREELDVTIMPTGEFMRVLHEYPDITVELTVYTAKIVQGTPKLLEHVDMKYITPDEIGDYDFCPADTEILSRIVERRETLFGL